MALLSYLNKAINGDVATTRVMKKVLREVTCVMKKIFREVTNLFKTTQNFSHKIQIQHYISYILSVSLRKFSVRVNYNCDKRAVLAGNWQ